MKKVAAVIVIALFANIAAQLFRQQTVESWGGYQGGVNYEEFRQEAFENGASQEAIRKIEDFVDDLSSSDKSELTDAYGDISGSYFEVRQQLEADPERRALVGKAVVATTLESLELPIQLDDSTILSNVEYEESTASILYHNTITLDLSWMSAAELNDLRDEIAAINPDAVCKLSMPVLKQGFDMVYTYRTSGGKELFRIIRDYEGCQALGFS